MDMIFINFKIIRFSQNLHAFRKIINQSFNRAAIVTGNIIAFNFFLRIDQKSMDRHWCIDQGVNIKPIDPFRKNKIRFIEFE